MTPQDTCVREETRTDAPFGPFRIISLPSRAHIDSRPAFFFSSLLSPSPWLLSYAPSRSATFMSRKWTAFLPGEVEFRRVPRNLECRLSFLTSRDTCKPAGDSRSRRLKLFLIPVRISMQGRLLESFAVNEHDREKRMPFSSRRLIEHSH